MNLQELEQKINISEKSSANQDSEGAFQVKLSADKPQEISNSIAISARDISKSFRVGTQDVKVLHSISFDVKDGEFLIIIGPSGCGKSTLLYTILGLELPTEGNILLKGKDVYKGTTEDDRSAYRKKGFGMVYQQSNWIRSLSVVENVALPLLLLGKSEKEATEKAMQVLSQVKMDLWAEYVPTELSSGQQQKVAVARAIITNPDFIVADEPTGNLDFKSGEAVMHLLSDLRHIGKTVLMVTHDLEYLKYATIAVTMLDGRVESILRGEEIKKYLLNVNLKRGER